MIRAQIFAALLARRRLILTTTSLLALAGFGAWVGMPREEDPQFPRRDGLILASFPGADVRTVERLLLEPLEEHLAEVPDIDFIKSTARAGTALLHVRFRETVYDTERAWDEVEDALEEASAEFPPGVPTPVLEDDLVSQEAVVYAVVGSADPLVLADRAERLKRHLLGLELVKEVRLIADPGEQITIEYEDHVARRLGVDPVALGHQIARRSSITPGGMIHLGSKAASLRPVTEFRSLEELRRTPVLLPSGRSVPLATVARVRRGPTEPKAELMRWNGEPAVGVAVVPQDGRDRVRFGAAVRTATAEVAGTLPGVRVEEMIFQPDMVEQRLDQLTESLLLGMLIVAAVLFLSMGLRLGIAVALVVPLVTLVTIAVFALFGGILHQVSVAALVIALGMLVDNAIMMVEQIQYRIDLGISPREASAQAAQELAVPLGTATGTTLAAFLPMLIARGNTADFTRSIPIMIMLAIAASYLFAVFATPVLAELLLRPRQPGASPQRPGALTRRLARLAVDRPLRVLAGAACLLLAALASSRWVEPRFFPPADRPTMLVDLEMPEGTHLEATDAAAVALERALLAHEHVTSVGTYVGRNGPKFYYNMIQRPNTPHRAMLIVDAVELEQVEALAEWSRTWAQQHLPTATVVAQRLAQGPPVDAPVALRILGWDLEALERVAEALMRELRSIDGTRDVRHDLGLGVPTIRFEIDDAAAARHGADRTMVARSLLGRTLGTEIGQYRKSEDPIPIRLRSRAGETMSLEELESLDVLLENPRAKPAPVSQMAAVEVEWMPAVIHHYDRRRCVLVMAQLAAGANAFEIAERLVPRLAEIELPPGIRLQMAGELEESGKANSAIFRQLPLGLLLLLSFLLMEFDSFRRVAIVMATVPLAAIGVIPGLALTRQPFGFMSLLGVLSLVGIVVNNAIVLLDTVERRRAAGASVSEALATAVERRARPILLTTATTVAGLLPLAFAQATLWPPLAWAMISGLLTAAPLALLVIPALYQLSIGRWAPPAPPQPEAAASSSLTLEDRKVIP